MNRRYFFNTFLIVSGIVVVSSCNRHRVAQHKELADLFVRADSVQILSYLNRTYETPVIEGEERTSMDTASFVVADLRILESTIKETLALTPRQRDSLFALLSSDMCEIAEAAACYDPRHAIIFFNSNRQPFGYIEVCFDCFNYQTSGNFHFNFCGEKSSALQRLFVSFGIEYFGAAEF